MAKLCFARRSDDEIAQTLILHGARGTLAVILTDVPQINACLR